jgi:hypothetical protein
LLSSAAPEGGTYFALAALWFHHHVSNLKAVRAAFAKLGATIEGRSVVTPGRYFVWFKTPIGEGSGVAELFADGRLQGIDSTFCYTGTWSLNAGRLHARLSAERTTPGPPGVFGMDELDIAVTEYARDGDSVMCAGFAKQSPGLRMEVTITRMPDEAHDSQVVQAGS